MSEGETKPATGTTSPGVNISAESFTIKRVMGIILIVALIAFGIGWVALSIAGLPGWVNILFIVVAILLLVVIAWLFFSS